MRIAVVAPLAAGSSFAHAINSVKMAEGFARLGHDVEIVCRTSEEGSVAPELLRDQYGLRSAVRWLQLPYDVGDQRAFTLRAVVRVLRTGADFVYARHYRAPLWTSRFRVPTVVETHAHPDNRARAYLRMMRGTRHRSFRAVVTISRVLADHYVGLGVPPEKLLVLPDAVDVELFRRPDVLPRSPLRGEGPHVVYAGHLYDYKGIPTVLEAARKMPQVQFHFVGGWPDDVARQQSRAAALGLENVEFYGLVSHGEVPPFLWHADLLLLPPSQHHPSARWTSPLKLGEYLASETPVLVTDIPALRAWVTDEQVWWVPPDDAQRLAEGITEVLGEKDASRRRVQAARELAERFSYRERARRVLQAATPSQCGTNASSEVPSQSRKAA